MLDYLSQLTLNSLTPRLIENVERRLRRTNKGYKTSPKVFRSFFRKLSLVPSFVPQERTKKEDKYFCRAVFGKKEDLKERVATLSFAITNYLLAVFAGFAKLFADKESLLEGSSKQKDKGRVSAAEHQELMQTLKEVESELPTLYEQDLKPINDMLLHLPILNNYLNQKQLTSENLREARFYQDKINKKDSFIENLSSSLAKRVQDMDGIPILEPVRKIILGLIDKIDKTRAAKAAA